MDNTLKTLSLIQKDTLEKTRPSRNIRVFGIDLGTTNSTITKAEWKTRGNSIPLIESVELVQPTLEGNYTHLLLPSVVAIHSGQVYVGEGAKRLRSRSSELGLKQNQNLFYECKNDIGNRKTYHRAPDGFRSAAEIESKVLDFLIKASSEEFPSETDRIVVTVPASFQAAQRKDTIHAAEMAGLDLEGGDLLDEPVAAFLDYLFCHGMNLTQKLKEQRILVVFDFGGGTCDVAVFRLSIKNQLHMESLSVSRYHRLGGGDIDAAIVHDVLIPQLCEQNNINILDLTYEDKKKIIEPALLGLAEMLKMGLCIEIQRLNSHGKYEEVDKNQVYKSLPGVHYCQLGEQLLKLSSTKLTALQFENIIKPFLDQDMVFARETEYRMTCSIFAPLLDALDRAGIQPDEVDFCLAAGGSSLIFHVMESLKSFFCNGELLSFSDRDTVKTCVSRGAAYHALTIEAFGKALVQPICHDAIAIRTASGLVPLVPQSAVLPYPSANDFASNHDLAVPKNTLLEPCQLRVELVAVSDKRPLFSEVWSIPGPVNQGTPITIEYQIDENQLLSIRAHLKDDNSSKEFEATIENPLTNVVNPHPKRLQIEELEEELKTRSLSRSEISEKLEKIGELSSDLGQREKAIAFLKQAIRTQNTPDVNLLNRLATYYGMNNDFIREEKTYRDATEISPWSGTWFNLALSLRKQDRLSDAAEAINQAIEIDREAPYLVLAAMIDEKMGESAKSQQRLSEAMELFDPVRTLDDWQLGWFVTAAKMLDDDTQLASGRAEQQKRSKRNQSHIEENGELPIISQGIMKR